jgi:hypothetical protein
MGDLNEYIETLGVDSTRRLVTIADMNLGLRSMAAKRVIYKRQRRRNLMNMGLTFENAVLIVNNEYAEENEGDLD